MSYTVRFYQPGDEVKIIETFNTVFSEVCGASFKPMTLEHWRWKYLSGPTKSQIMLAIDDQTGDVVAQYAGPVLFANYLGQKKLAWQVVDAMSRNDFRRGRGASGAFIDAAHKAIKEDFTQRPDKCYASGFPTQHHCLTGMHHLGYVVMADPVKALTYALPKPISTVQSPSVYLSDQNIRIEPIKRFGAWMDALWSDLSKKLPLAIWRDSNYLNWRYVDCPVYDYQSFGLWDTDEILRGVIVLHPDWLERKTTMIYELLVNPEDEKIVKLVMEFAQNFAREQEQEKLCIWLPTNHPHFTFLESLGASVEDTDFIQVFRSFDQELEVDWARKHWYWTIGDSDIN